MQSVVENGLLRAVGD